MKVSFKIFCIILGFSIPNISTLLHKSDGTIKAIVKEVSTLKAPDGDIKTLTLTFTFNGVNISKYRSCDIGDIYNIGDTVIVDYFLSKGNEIESIELRDLKYKYVYPLFFMLIGLPSFFWGITVIRDIQ